MDAKRRQIEEARAKAPSSRRLVRDVCAGLIIALIFMAPPGLLAPLFDHSTYLFGMAAILICATRLGWVSVLAGAAVIFSVGVATDRSAQVPDIERVLRPTLFLIIAIVVAWWSRATFTSGRRSKDDLADLAHKEAVLRSILATGPDAMLMINSRAIVSSFSPAAERLFGWTADEVIGRNVNMLMPSPYHAEHDGYIAHYLTSGERKIIGQSREVTGLRKDGSHFPMVLHVGEAMVADERYFTGFVHDLTALNDAHDRTNELRSQLTHVWRMNSLGEMAAVLAHELNQPLTAISNYVRGARTMVNRLELADEELIDALEETGNQALRAGEIIRRTRAMVSRNDAEKQPVSLAALISEIDLMMGIIAREAAVILSYDLATGPDEVDVDRIQIQQVVSNLVRNAVDAMRDSPRRQLEISTEQTPDGWVVRVQDSGPGIPVELGNQLFTPLMSTKAQGMGLGLSISRTIIQHHDGDIWVETSRLGGASFCFSLPAGSSRSSL